MYKAFQSSNAIKGVHIDCPNLLSLEYESFYYAQNIPLYWYSANCPQLAQRALGGNASNPFGIAHLPRIYLMRGPVIDAWAGAYTPIAEVEQTYKNRSDFPGERTLGLLYQAGSTSNNVAWIVDGTPNYGLFVASVPEAVGAPSPTFGEHLGHVATNAVADASGATTIHFNSAIYSNQNYSVETSADKGATWIAPAVTNAGAVYAYPADGFYRVTWLWSPVAYQILGAAPGGGSVAISGTTVEEGYYAAGSSATLTAIPPADQRFERWEGDVATERMYDNPLVVVADAPKSLTAVFADGWILADGSTTLSNKTWSFTVRSATVGEASGLEIVNVLTAPAAQTTLDFGRVESDTGSRVIKVAASVFSSKTYLGSFLAPDMLAIGNSAFSQASVTNVVVSTNLVAIGQYAFHRATQLAGFWPRTLPGLSTLPSYAFYYTIALGGDFVFPNLTSFGEYAFGGIENTAGPKITSVLATNCTMIGNSSFAFCYYLVEARFSDDLATITAAAFKHDRLLRDFHPMTLPQLTTLGNEAFMYCHYLTGDFVVPILESTGSGCLRSTALSSFTAPSCTNLGSYSFDSCSFQSAKDGSWNRYTSEYYLTNVTVSADVETIGELAMSGCGSLKCFNPTDLRSLTTLSRYAFKGCSALADGHTDFYLPKITVINNEVFYGARATMVHAPLVTSVGDSALRTGYITNAILSRAIGHVGNSAFYYSSQLVTPIYLFSDSLTGIAGNAFRGASKTEVHIKAPNLSAMGYEAFCYSPPPIYWYSPIKPGFTFGIRCISSGQPPQSVTTFFRLYLKTTPAVESWGQYYTPVAELDPAYLTRSDYLALKADRKTRNVLGLMKQGTDPDSSYAWIIDAREHTATTLLVR